MTKRRGSLKAGCIGTTKLTERQVRFIRDVNRVHMKERLAAGYVRPRRGLYQRMAKMFGISQSMIKAIVRRRKWRHLR